MSKVVGFLVEEVHPLEGDSTKPEAWYVYPVHDEDQPGDHVFLREGRVIRMSIGCTPEEDPDSVFCALEFEGETHQTLGFVWAAFSAREKAQAWISSRQQN